MKALALAGPDNSDRRRALWRQSKHDFVIDPGKAAYKAAHTVVLNGRVPPRRCNERAIIAALEQAGIEFIPGGVRSRKETQPIGGKPFATA